MPGRPTGASVRPLIVPMGVGFFVQDHTNSPSRGSVGSEKLWICPRAADCAFGGFVHAICVMMVDLTIMTSSH